MSLSESASGALTGTYTIYGANGFTQVQPASGQAGSNGTWQVRSENLTLNGTAPVAISCPDGAAGRRTTGNQTSSGVLQPFNYTDCP